MIPVS